jgi:hypothetical protein
MKLKVLYISKRKENFSYIIQLVAVDESNQMRMVKLSFDEDILLVEKNIVSKPINYFGFNRASSMGFSTACYLLS